jgi:transglutaminase-like putative cysteine protease
VSAQVVPRPAVHPAPAGASAALALVTVAGAAGLARTFADAAFWWPVVAVALAVHALGAWAHRRGLPTAVFVALGVVVAGVLTTWVVAGAATAYGLPGPGALDALRQTLARGWDALLTERPPVPTSPGLVAWSMLGIAAVAVGAEAIARHAAPAAALAPSVASFAVLAALGTARWRVGATLAYAAACLGYLLVTHRAERPSPPGGAPVPWAAAFGLGAAALVVGSATAALVPTEGGPLVDLRALGRPGAGPAGGGRIDPVVDLRRRLLRSGDLEVFRVAAPTRQRWRLVGLEGFDGDRWTLAPGPPGARLPTRPPGRAALVQRVEIAALRSPHLPAAATPVAARGVAVRAGPGGGLFGAPTREGMRYRVWSDPRAGPHRLSAADRARLSALPADLPRSVRAAARAVTRRSATPRERAEALEAFFLDGSFRYDLSVPPPAGPSALASFLERRSGFCEHFAAAHAAMARSVGLPARVVVGFTAGTWDPGSRTLVVRGRDAHAWTEIWIDGEGWVGFEPTPAGDAPGQADPALGAPAAPSAGTPTTTTAAPTTEPGSGAAPPPPAAAGGAPDGDPVPVEGPAPPGLGARSRPSLLLAAAGVVAALGAAGIRRVARALRRRHRRRAPDPAVALAGAYADAVELLESRGLPVAAGITPHALAGRVAERAAAAGAAFARLVDRYTRVVYGPAPATADDARAAWEHHRSLRRALRGRLDGRSTWLRRRRAATAGASAPPSPRRTA